MLDVREGVSVNDPKVLAALSDAFARTHSLYGEEEGRGARNIIRYLIGRLGIDPRTILPSEEIETEEPL